MKCTLLLVLLPFFGWTQNQLLTDFNQERSKIDQKLMLTLTTWSAVNAGISAVGWASTEGEARYFHQMNTMWSGINLMLSVPGYFKAKKQDASSFGFSATLHEQSKTEKIFLFNTALDVAYVTSGFLLRSAANNDPSNYQRFRGFGNGIILQGGFLFLFDAAAAIIHHQHAKKKLHPFLNKITLSDTGMGLKLKL